MLLMEEQVCHTTLAAGPKNGVHFKVQDGVALKFAQLRYDERKEQYLNAADRLCACIVRGEVDENQYRQDYRPWIGEIVKQHADKLGPDTRHRNIMKIHNAWSEDKSAAGPR